MSAGATAGAATGAAVGEVKGEAAAASGWCLRFLFCTALATSSLRRAALSAAIIFWSSTHRGFDESSAWMRRYSGSSRSRRRYERK